MRTTERQLARARKRAELARTRLTGTLVEMQTRLRPAALMEDAIGELREKASDGARDVVAYARSQPIAAIGIIGSLVAYVFRDRLIHAVLGLFSRDRET